MRCENILCAIKEAANQTVERIKKTKNPDWNEEQREQFDEEVQLIKKLRQKCLSNPPPESLLCYKQERSKIIATIKEAKRLYIEKALEIFPKNLAKRETQKAFERLREISQETTARIRNEPKTW